MDGGFQVIIILIFVAMVLLEGLGRKRKRGRVPGPVPAPPQPREGAPRPAAGRRPGGVGVRPEEGSSEGMIPREIWEELMGLARGEPPAPSREPPPPERDPRSLEELDPRPLPEPWAREELPRKAPAPRPVPRAVATKEEVKPPLRKPPPAAPVKGAVVPAGRGALGKVGERSVLWGWEGRGVRREPVGALSRTELRRAVILKEILGPPAALKE